MDANDPIDLLSGPHLECAVTETYTLRGADLWRVLELARDDCEVRVKVDWNGIDARAWDMSFVPMDLTHVRQNYLYR